MKSILQNKKECYVCQTTRNLHSHHIFFGTANRKQSEKFGLKVWLCMEHHTGNGGVHFDKHMDNFIKMDGQLAFERVHGDRDYFRKVFGRNYLD